jgi:predicted transcriptional regulator
VTAARRYSGGMSNSKPLTLNLDEETSRRLDELARRSRKSSEAIVIEAVREHLKHADPTLGTDKPVPPPKGG